MRVRRMTRDATPDETRACDLRESARPRGA
jgi:hypothetical protein